MWYLDLNIRISFLKINTSIYIVFYRDITVFRIKKAKENEFDIAIFR